MPVHGLYGLLGLHGAYRVLPSFVYVLHELFEMIVPAKSVKHGEQLALLHASLSFPLRKPVHFFDAFFFDAFFLVAFFLAVFLLARFFAAMWASSISS